MRAEINAYLLRDIVFPFWDWEAAETAPKETETKSAEVGPSTAKAGMTAEQRRELLSSALARKPGAPGKKSGKDGKNTKSGTSSTVLGFGILLACGLAYSVMAFHWLGY